jgi:predicted nucleic acid-binding protein
MSGPAVVDASALAEFLLGTERGERVARRLAEASELHAPHLVVTETLSVIRGWVLGGQLEPGRGEAACRDLSDLPLQLWDARPLIPYAWSRRHNLSAYDATYVALAAALECRFVTSDQRLARSASADVEIDLIAS